MWGYAKGILVAILLIFLITFGVENGQTVQLNYYLKSLTFNLPIYSLIYAPLLLGIVLGMMVGLKNRLGMRKTIKSLRLDNIELKDKVASIEEAEKNDGKVGREEGAGNQKKSLASGTLE